MSPDTTGRPTVAVHQIERRSAAEAVREELLRLIEQGDFPIGSKLPREHDLSGLFGVSRPVVREALGSLRLSGVLESRAGLGTFVRRERLNGGLVLQGRYSSDDLYEVRRHLEIPGAALASINRTPQQLRKLTQIVARHVGNGDVGQWVKDDLEFHVTLAEATGNALHARLIAELRELQFEQSVAMAERMGGLEAPEAEHRAILEALRRRDQEGAKEATLAHLDAIRERSRIAVQVKGR